MNYRNAHLTQIAFEHVIIVSMKRLMFHYLLILMVSPYGWSYNGEKVGEIPILKSAAISNYKDFFKGVKKLQSLNDSSSNKSWPYRTIFVSNMYHACNEKGDIWVRFSDPTKKMKEYLDQNSSLCLKKTTSGGQISDAIANLSNAIKIKHGVEMQKSPVISNDMDYLNGLSKLLVAFEIIQLEYGSIPSVLLSENFHKEKSMLWVDHRATPDKIAQFLK